MITWQNIKNAKLTGTCPDRASFDKLNKFAGGGLKIVSTVSNEVDEIVKAAKEDTSEDKPKSKSKAKATKAKAED